MKNSHRREAFILAAATGLLGVTFGVLADSAEFSLAQAVVLSSLTFTGASQFAAVSVIDSGGNPITAVGSALLLAARNSLYGPLVAPLLRTPSRARRAVAIHLVIDETTAMATAQNSLEESRDAFWFTGIWLFIFWNSGTIIGVLVGGLLEDPSVWGLDAAFPAAFVALLLPHLRTRAKRITALMGAVITVVAVPLSPVGLPVLLSLFAVGPGIWFQYWKGSK
tara:strand:- start:710 stop:1378 length:669 start_codon:yes stop_codon:yes gene_type:complete